MVFVILPGGRHGDTERNWSGARISYENPDGRIGHGVSSRFSASSGVNYRQFMVGFDTRRPQVVAKGFVVGDQCGHPSLPRV